MAVEPQMMMTLIMIMVMMKHLSAAFPVENYTKRADASSQALYNVALVNHKEGSEIRGPENK
jgi:hypothetical protein